jgi:hypothetical protein
MRTSTLGVFGSWCREVFGDLVPWQPGWAVTSAGVVESVRTLVHIDRLSWAVMAVMAARARTLFCSASQFHKPLTNDMTDRQAGYCYCTH